MTNEEKIKIQEKLTKNAKRIAEIRAEEEQKRKGIAENLKNFHMAVDQCVETLRRQDEIKANDSENEYERNSERIDEALKNNDVEAIQKFLKDFQQQ